MPNELLLSRCIHEGRIHSLSQVNESMLVDYVSGFPFDWVYYSTKNNLSLETKEDAIVHFIREGFSSGLLANAKQEEPLTYDLEYGVNIFGYFNTVSGQGNSVSAIHESLKLLDIPIVVNDVNCRIPACKVDKNRLKSRYLINIFHINPDRADLYIRLKSFMRNRINIAIWTWETEEIPSFWKKYISWFNEIWTISNFCATAISRESIVPVVNIFPPVEIHSIPGNFGKKFIEDNHLENKFIFFYCFDNISYIDRKNPHCLLDAFSSVYKPDENALIIKTMNMSPKLQAELTRPGVYIINTVLSYDDYISLFKETHCYVSPHRSEGQGRTIMEAMLLAKKVIVTGYSGNLDFTDITNSYLIKWQYTTCTDDTIYHGHKWADPSVGHLVKLMFRSIDDFHNGRCTMNTKAQTKISTCFSYSSCSKILNGRLRLYNERIKNSK
jgi:hypothetical protein